MLSLGLYSNTMIPEITAILHRAQQILGRVCINNKISALPILFFHYGLVAYAMSEI